MKEKEARRKPAKETLRTNIKDYIQKQIAAGVYRPGDRIVETQLAREMNVSQAPVREAILEMVALGMLEERPYSGHFVRALGPKEIEDIYQTRAVVEEYAAQRAADRATEDQLAEMKRLLQEMDAKRDLDRFVHQDMEFHNLVMDAAESAALKRAWSMLRMAEWTYIAAAITKSSLEEMIQQHWTIFRYLEARQPTAPGRICICTSRALEKRSASTLPTRRKKSCNTRGRSSGTAPLRFK